MAVRIQFRRGTAAEWSSANPVLAAGELGYETDTAKFKLGNGTDNWDDLVYAGVNQTDIENAVDAVIGGAPAALDTLTELAAALNNDENFATSIVTQISDHTSATTNVHGIANTALLITQTQLDGFANVTTNIHGIADTSALVVDADLSPINNSISEINLALDDLQTEKADLAGPTFTGTVSLPADTSIGDVSATEISYLNNVSSAIQTQINSKAAIESPEFTGTVILPATTSIGNVSAAEISYLNNVTSAIQTQIDGKLDSGVASTTYAALAGAEFTGNVVLTANTSIGSVSATEISYLNGVTSAVQDQLDDKAPIESPTFTGTVSGITASMVGLGNVDNTSDADKPISDATQDALDAKLNLSGGTMTGKITLDGDPTQALHAVTKQYVDSVEAGLKAKPSVVAATTGNLTATYNNGTNGVGATLTATSNGAFPQIDGVSVTTVSGQRGVLVKNQTDPAENGRYNLTTQGDASNPWVLTRCGLCDEATEIPGAYVFVTDGTVNGQTGWVQHVDDPATFTVGTDDIDVFQFAGAGSVTAGNNISVSGNQVSVVADPSFGNVIVTGLGVRFPDLTIQTTAGVPSITTISQKTDSYTLSNLNERDTIVEISKSTATTLTIPTNASVAYPVGTTIDIIQTGTGQVTIAGAGGVTVNATPGLKLRAQWSSATLLKRGENTWLAFGDLSA